MASWESLTGQFGQGEMSHIRNLPASELAPVLAHSAPVVALRVLAEILLNGDTTKLDELLANPSVSATWKQFEADTGVDERDHDYARQLRERLPQA